MPYNYSLKIPQILVSIFMKTTPKQEEPLRGDFSLFSLLSLSSLCLSALSTSLTKATGQASTAEHRVNKPKTSSSSYDTTHLSPDTPEVVHHEELASRVSSPAQVNPKSIARQFNLPIA
jgi:hypothetical protein